MLEMLRAFYVSNDSAYDEPEGAIVFAVSPSQARHIATYAIDAEACDLKVERRKEADAYRRPNAAEPYIEHRTAVLLSLGWWLECSNCYRRVTGDDEETDGHVCVGSRVFCSQDCRHAANRKRSIHHAKTAGLVMSALTKWPGIIISDLCLWCLEPQIEMKLPNHAAGHISMKHGENTIHLVGEGMLQAWEAFTGEPVEAVEEAQHAR